MFACLTKAAGGANTRFSCSTDSIMDDAIASPPRGYLAVCVLHRPYANTSTKPKTCKGGAMLQLFEVFPSTFPEKKP
jgi:hypothetical protein